MSRGLRLLATTHLGMMSGEHPLELEPALRPLLTFTCSPQRTILAFRRYAGKVWLLELGGLLQLVQLVCAMGTVGEQRAMGVRSSGERADEPEARLCDAPGCTALVAARSSSCSGSHLGCTQWISTVGSVVVAYSAQSARIS